MKLNTFLQGRAGKELSTQDISVIMEMVTDIKTKAVTDTEATVTKLTNQNKEYAKELAVFKTVEADKGLKEAFIKAGGNAEKFESFKKTVGTVDKIEDFNFEESFTEFPSLKGEASKTPETPEPEDEVTPEDPFNTFNNLPNQKTNDVPKSPATKSPVGEGSLIR